MTAIAISNAVDLYNRPKREKRYLEIIKRYEKDELMVFPELLNELIEELEKRPRDVLRTV